MEKLFVRRLFSERERASKVLNSRQSESPAKSKMRTRQKGASLIELNVGKCELQNAYECIWKFVIHMWRSDRKQKICARTDIVQGVEMNGMLGANLRSPHGSNKFEPLEMGSLKPQCKIVYGGECASHVRMPCALLAKHPL